MAEEAKVAEFLQRESQNLSKNADAQKLQLLISSSFCGGPYSEAVRDRKKHSFQLLKDWDDEKCRILQAHRSALENFARKIDKKQNFLKNAVFAVKSFFEQLLAQENAYVDCFRSKIPRLAGIYAENAENSQNSSIFPQISQSLARIDAVLAENARKHAVLAEFIEKTLLSSMIYAEISAYEAVLSQKRDEIVANRREIATISQEISQVSAAHARFFAETLQKSRTKTAEKLDFFDSEAKFRGLSQKQVRLQRTLATNTVKFYREWQKLEENRVKTLQSALQKYAVFCENLHLSQRNTQENEEFSQENEEFSQKNEQSSQKTQENLAKSIENWDFDDDLLRFLDLEEDQSQEIFSCFFSLEDIKLPEIAVSPLIIKEFAVERLENSLLGGFLQKNSKLVITVDENLLFFDEFDENCEKPADFLLKIADLQVKRRNEPLVIEIREKVQGILWNSTKSHVFRVKTADAFDEIIIFLEFIKLRNWV